MNRKVLFTSFNLLLLAFVLLRCQSAATSKHTTLPGQYRDFTLLPNGWKLTPAGTKQAAIGDLPLNIVITPDERWAVTTNNGESVPSLSLIDLHTFTEKQRVPLHNAWRGLALDAAGNRLFVSGGNDDAVLVFRLNDSGLQKLDSIALAPDSVEVSVSGLAWDRMGKRLLAVSKESNRLYVLNPDAADSVYSLPLAGKCYDVITDHGSQRAYVSVWGKGEIAEIDLRRLIITRRFLTGAHPCEMRITSDDKRLFVATANANAVSVVDLLQGKTVETLNTSLHAADPPGSTPNAIALARNEHVLIVANADNNDLALFDIRDPNQSRSMGFIPVGWYPTAVAYQSKSDQILCVNGKGLHSAANPKGPGRGTHNKKKNPWYIAHMFKGVLSGIPFPAESRLAAYSQQVYANTPLQKNRQQHTPDLPGIIGKRHTGKRSSKIRHVFYIVRENRTYDQVFGDLLQGNGDSSLCLFPRHITPNAHALVEQFTLFDNFYTDAEVSADGHNWSMAAYATDYVEKLWPTLYGKRGGTYDFEGGVPIARPASGYIWDAVLARGLRFRNYGEYTWHDKSNPGLYRANDAYLRPFTSTTYPCFDLSVPDTTRFTKWEKEFRAYAAGDSLPDFSLIRLPNDHTAGTRQGMPTVQAMVADNDYALGLMVQTISESKYWESSLILVVEDDAQSGSDHVDAHRSVLLAISPFIKHGYVDHTMYSSSSVLKTIELVLGLPVMTQFDLAAIPLNRAFSARADLAPYHAIPPNMDLNEKNASDAYGAKRCSEMNLATEDAIPDIEFNEIIWKAVRGADSEMPPPVRSAFVRILDRDEEDND